MHSSFLLVVLLATLAVSGCSKPAVQSASESQTPAEAAKPALVAEEVGAGKSPSSRPQGESFPELQWSESTDSDFLLARSNLLAGDPQLAARRLFGPNGLAPFDLSIVFFMRRSGGMLPRTAEETMRYLFLLPVRSLGRQTGGGVGPSPAHFVEKPEELLSTSSQTLTSFVNGELNWSVGQYNGNLIVVLPELTGSDEVRYVGKPLQEMLTPFSSQLAISNYKTGQFNESRYPQESDMTRRYLRMITGLEAAGGLHDSRLAALKMAVESLILRASTSLGQLPASLNEMSLATGYALANVEEADPASADFILSYDGVQAYRMQLRFESGLILDHVMYIEELGPHGSFSAANKYFPDYQAEVGRPMTILGSFNLAPIPHAPEVTQEAD